MFNLTKFPLIITAIILCRSTAMTALPAYPLELQSSIDGKSILEPVMRSFEYLYAKFQAYKRPRTSKLGVCTIIRNEGPYLAEWILYHWIIGFEQFFLYDNGSNDTSKEVLIPFINKGLVTLIDWPPQDKKDPKRHGQCIGHCHNRSRTDVAWMGHFDIDEFIVIPSQEIDIDSLQAQRLLPKFIGDLENKNVGSVILDRLEFDSNSHTSRPPGLVISNYNSRVISMQPRHFSAKPIVLIKALLDHRGHDVMLRDGYRKFTADNQEYKILEETKGPVTEPMHINHYVTRSYSECMFTVKNRDVGDWRRMHGKSLCDRQMLGKPEYQTFMHMKDRTLSSSLSPQVLTKLIKKIESDCKCSLK